MKTTSSDSWNWRPWMKKDLSVTKVGMLPGLLGPSFQEEGSTTITPIRQSSALAKKTNYHDP